MDMTDDSLQKLRMIPSNVIIGILFLITIFSISRSSAFITKGDPKCVHLRTQKMLKAKCFDMNLKEVPQFLNTAIEVLDLAYNRIKKLKKMSFQRYSSVRYLILYENMIQYVEPDTFSHLSSLEEIDLSNNGLTTIPLEIFQLPSLRNLYVDSNELINIQTDIQNLEKPIRAPLEYLNIADCGIQEIPDIGVLPYLWHLNASLNPLTDISVQSFLPMCRVRTIVLKDTKIPTCACQTILEYFDIRKVKVYIDCNIIERTISCPELGNITLYASQEYEECSSVALNKKAQNIWLMVAGGIGGCLMIFICIIYYLHSRKSKRTRQMKQMKTINLQVNGNEELLKSSS